VSRKWGQSVGHGMILYPTFNWTWVGDNLAKNALSEISFRLGLVLLTLQVENIIRNRMT